jgi:hypothetical protein
MRAPEERHQRTKSDVASPELITLLFLTINIGLLRSRRNDQLHRAGQRPALPGAPSQAAVRRFRVEAESVIFSSLC